MEKVVPASGNFNFVKKLSGFCDILLWISTGITILISIFDINRSNHEVLISYLYAVSSVFVVSYIIFDSIKSYLQLKSENKRRLDFIDNSFGTNLSGERSVAYYTNDKLNPGIYKMAVNCFENCYFSYHVSRRMLIPIVLRNLAMIAIFVFVASLGQKNVVILLIQLAIPVFLLQQLVRLVIFVLHTENILSNFKSLFSGMKHQPYESRIPELIRCIMEYESNISWASILLSQKIFDRQNKALSEKWSALKHSYSIPD